MAHRWDGTLKGEIQPLSTFAYYLRYKCGEKIYKKQGNITLIR